MCFLLEYAGNAGDMMKTLKLSDYCGIVIVSGDGLIHEVNNYLKSTEYSFV